MKCYNDFCGKKATRAIRLGKLVFRYCEKCFRRKWDILHRKVWGRME